MPGCDAVGVGPNGPAAILAARSTVGAGPAGAGPVDRRRRSLTSVMSDTSPPIFGLPNLRDLGGHPTCDGGRVRRGVVYRSTELSHLDADGVAALAQLRIRRVYDLRTREEREMQPDRLPGGTELVVLDVLEDSADASPAALMELIADPPAADAVLGGGGAARMFEGKYREFVSLPSARAAYGRLFSDLAAAAHRPALIHCTTGKDRTGWAAAALLLLLDVPLEAILEDYLRSNESVLPLFLPFLDRYAARGGDPESIRPLLGVQASYLEAALDEMGRRHGSVEGYFADALGIGPAGQAILRSELVERP